jgi:hypothetical protein
MISGGQLNRKGIVDEPAPTDVSDHAAILPSTTGAFRVVTSRHSMRHF